MSLQDTGIGWRNMPSSCALLTSHHMCTFQLNGYVQGVRRQQQQGEKNATLLGYASCQVIFSVKTKVYFRGYLTWRLKENLESLVNIG